jgi:hypothetical protein
MLQRARECRRVGVGRRQERGGRGDGAGRVLILQRRGQHAAQQAPGRAQVRACVCALLGIGAGERQLGRLRRARERVAPGQRLGVAIARVERRCVRVRALGQRGVGVSEHAGAGRADFKRGAGSERDQGERHLRAGGDGGRERHARRGVGHAHEGAAVGQARQHFALHRFAQVRGERALQRLLARVAERRGTAGGRGSRDRRQSQCVARQHGRRPA